LKFISATFTSAKPSDIILCCGSDWAE